VSHDPLAPAFAQGSAALKAGDFCAAERIFGDIVQRDPRAHDAWLALAVIAMRSGMPEKAVEHAKRAVELDRNNALYLNNLGIAQGERGDYLAAEDAFRQALATKPGYAEAHYSLAKALHKQGRLDESLQAYEQAHALEPRSVPIQVGLCGMYRIHGQPDRALEFLRTVAAQGTLGPSLAPHFAACVADVEGPAAAVGWLREELARQPNAQGAHHMLAVLLLSLGQWREGWNEFLWRNHPTPGRAKPVLDGRLEGKRILLRGEQGLGDVLFFLRFSEELQRRRALIGLDCSSKLMPLVNREIRLQQPPYDLELSIGDLPAVLGTETVPPAFRLRVDEGRRSRAREMLARLGRPPYLGITWQAGTDILHRREFGMDMALLFKEVPPELLGKAARGWPGTLLSLQRNPAADDLAALASAAGATVHDLATVNEDLEDALAVLDQLHEYVAVSNTNIHLLAGFANPSAATGPSRSGACARICLALQNLRHALGHEDHRVVPGMELEEAPGRVISIPLGELIE
jgi:tetratricopeptide (TPR) repeat protein